MKKILSILTLLAICVFCTFGIFYLQRDTRIYNRPEILDTIETIQEFLYIEIPVVLGDMEKSVLLAGNVLSDALNPSDKIVIRNQAKSIDHLLKQKGDQFTKGELLFQYDGRNIVAPYVGRIDNITVNNKNLEISLTNYEKNKISFTLPQKYIDLIHIDDSISFSYNDSFFTGKISYISTILSPEGALCEAVYNDPELKIPINAKVDIKIIQDSRHSVIVIPSYAIISDNKMNDYLRIKVNNDEDGVKSEIRQITIGLRNEKSAEIVSGLNVGEIVLYDFTSVDNTSTEKNGDSLK